jgi:RNA polymerase sigma factor (sigma-70 family)
MVVQLTDAELVEPVISPYGDFEEWYRAAWPRLAATMAAYVGDRALGEDIASQAAADLFERWGRVAHPSAWCYRVAVNDAGRRARRAALARRAGERWQEAAVEMPELEPELWAAVGRLPPRQRLAIVLRYVARLTQQEVADAMKISPGTAAATLHSARSRLRAELRSPDAGAPDHDR